MIVMTRDVDAFEVRHDQDSLHLQEKEEVSFSSNTVELG